MSALAMHEPRTRTLQLSISTVGGNAGARTVARPRLAGVTDGCSPTAPGYTARTARCASSAWPLASSVRGLAAARNASFAGRAGTLASGYRKPTRRVVCAGADWFIASALAQQGRSNGFLSVAQDGLLTGYAGLARPRRSGSQERQSLLFGDWRDDLRPRFDSRRFSKHSGRTRASWIRCCSFGASSTRDPVSRRLVAGRAHHIPILATTRAHPCLRRRPGRRRTRARERLLMMAIDARARAVAARRGTLSSAHGRRDGRRSTPRRAPFVPSRRAEVGAPRSGTWCSWCLPSFRSERRQLARAWRPDARLELGGAVPIVSWVTDVLVARACVR